MSCAQRRVWVVLGTAGMEMDIHLITQGRRSLLGRAPLAYYIIIVMHS